jgi:hypothetical protein
MSEPLITVSGKGRVTIFDNGDAIMYWERAGRQLQAKFTNFSEAKRAEAIEWAQETIKRMEQPDW